MNVLLEESEMNALTAICQREFIKKPATLVGIWIRENLKSHSEIGELVDLVREAKESGVNIEALLRKASRAKRKAA